MAGGAGRRRRSQAVYSLGDLARLSLTIFPSMNVAVSVLLIGYAVFVREGGRRAQADHTLLWRASGVRVSFEYAFPPFISVVSVFLIVKGYTVFV